MEPRIINQMAMVRLDVTIWSGRARLNRTDIKDASVLPPQALATLGSKKLFDPTQLKVFNTLKARAVRYLDCNGTRFIGGWATDVCRLSEINIELDNIRYDFDAAASKFFSGYESGVREWAAQFPEYEHVLLAAVPTLGALQRKFGFTWQTFQVTPIAQETAGNNLNDIIDDLDTSAMQEVADIIKDIHANTFAGRQTVTRKQFRPFNNLLSKLKALSFIHPHFEGLETLFESLVGGYIDRCDDPKFVSALSALLVALSTVDGIRAIIEPYNNGLQNTADVLDAVSMPAVAVDNVEPESVPEPEPEPYGFDVPVFGDEPVACPFVAPAPEDAEPTTVLDDGGLW